MKKGDKFRMYANGIKNYCIVTIKYVDYNGDYFCSVEVYDEDGVYKHNNDRTFSENYLKGLEEIR